MMKKRTFLKNLGAGLVTGASLSGFSIPQAMAAKTTDQPAGGFKLKPGEIQHMVIFNLKHDQNSPATLTFLKDAKRILSAIPVVKNFQVFSQVSKKNDYNFGFSMVFANQGDYEKYNAHPDHVSFVEQRWKQEVRRFLEIDFAAKSTDR